MTSPNRPQDKLAARIFLILHDSFSGKPAVGPTAIRCALVGAELAELIIARRITMENDLVVLGDPGSPGSDEISAFVVDSVSRQTGSYGVPTWLGAIGDALYELVAARMVGAGILVRSRGLVGRTQRYPAANLLAAAGPRVRLEHMVRRPRERDLPGAVCAALLGAVGAVGVLEIDGGRRSMRRTLNGIAEALPDDLRRLVMSVEVAHESGSLPPSLRLRPSST
jgi:Golgi phosphoprotein 3 (GPP34)